MGKQFTKEPRFLKYREINDIKMASMNACRYCLAFFEIRDVGLGWNDKFTIDFKKLAVR